MRNKANNGEEKGGFDREELSFRYTEDASAERRLPKKQQERLGQREIHIKGMKKWNEGEKRGHRERGNVKVREGDRERENQLAVKRGESEQRHCRINIPFV